MVRARMEGTELALDVADRGGIARTSGGYFSPYFTTKASGTGQGFPLCKIVEAHDGTIEVASTPGEGRCSSFVSRLWRRGVREREETFPGPPTLLSQNF
ncbi:MAG: ATP-binding protein [Bilophila wadsworthia]